MRARQIFGWVGELPSQRIAWALLAATAIGLEATALWFQYGMELQPCVMCIYIRLATLGIVAAGLVGMIGASRWRALRWFGFAVWGISAGYGLALSRELVTIQSPAAGDPIGGCSFLPNFPDWMPLHEWFPSVFMPTGSCLDSPWDWLGYSMAQWTVLTFACYLAALGLVVVAYLARRQP